jgi:hypothetical protein
VKELAETAHMKRVSLLAIFASFGASELRREVGRYKSAWVPFQFDLFCHR